MYRRPLGLVFVSAVFVACAHKPEIYPSDQFVMDTQRERIEARIDSNGINGPEIQISNGPDGLRGVAFNQPLFLHFKDGRASGTVANAPIDLTVERQDNKLRARGLYADAPVDLTVAWNEISGIVRNCSYWLKGSQAALQGYRQCGLRSQQEPTTVNVPRTLQSKSDEEKMAILAFFLAQ